MDVSTSFGSSVQQCTAHRWAVPKEVAAVLGVNVRSVVRASQEARMTARRIWEDGPWRVLVHQRSGWPLLPGHTCLTCGA